MVGAYFYQLKPIWEESFFRLTDSVIAECRRADQRSLVLRCKTGISRIELDRLLYCEVLGRTLLFHLSDGGVLESTGQHGRAGPGSWPPMRSFCARTARSLSTWNMSRTSPAGPSL